MQRWARVLLSVTAGAGIVTAVAAVLVLRDSVTADCQVMTASLDDCDPARVRGGQCAATICRFQGTGRRCATVYLRRQDGRTLHSEPICYDGSNDRERTVAEYDAFPVSPILFCLDPPLPFDQACSVEVKLERWP
jgi:hypothetical protein